MSLQLAKRNAINGLWRVLNQGRYACGMGEDGFTKDAKAPEVALPEGDRYRNKWVAVQDGYVVLEANSHQELVRKVRSRRLAAGSFVARHVETPPGEIVVGVG